MKLAALLDSITSRPDAAWILNGFVFLCLYPFVFSVFYGKPVWPDDHFSGTWILRCVAGGLLALPLALLVSLRSRRRLAIALSILNTVMAVAGLVRASYILSVL